jgi:anti-sigma factor RsiW
MHQYYSTVATNEMREGLAQIEKGRSALCESAGFRRLLGSARRVRTLDLYLGKVAAGVTGRYEASRDKRDREHSRRRRYPGLATGPITIPALSPWTG